MMKTLLEQMHPGFFDDAHIRELPGEEVFEEMLLYLPAFRPGKLQVKEEGVRFGFYQGSRTELLETVKQVVETWPPLFGETDRVYGGFLEDKLVSFCIVEDMGWQEWQGGKVHIGGPGCVGTLSEYRHRGIGLFMVQEVTKLLKAEGYDYSYIHYTGVAPFYAHLGYETVLKWNRYGILTEG